ncbi:tRNA (adenosine(37)-N6)-threonylcarbamoyltransferase complex dimerization subunit type 1 TsaB [Parabacteroides sp. PF5-9]|uniref:tRNA (adenosine(37)-N6)-threonylcarbamoyltransferase complex dimerization subunit type 1 TsaB n=1 Tax=Parabacteroides sp. PF5-9 TaxID=1742404 RepID=UPI0024770D16|nr:tRNA (adenosine(37)-N6)-threonylcarbamoyltransferase complex dimerization subunit type 1 TsaB [Parabacteroides sp. PF5-9]MDH6357204.1 tRNA threonylcarbamoyladenosine biosynthesis protein TsaB [Parabacteroides sp. PF5-9]
MPCVLHIETSTTVCSVALSLNSRILYNKVSFDGPSHAALLGVFVEEALQQLEAENIKLDAVAVSSGPGSYTGLRIGVSLAKGLCFGYGIPLIAVPTLELLAATAIQKTDDPDACYCAMLDARRMEVYAAIYDKELVLLRETAADIVDETTYITYLHKGKVYFFGNGSTKCQTVIHSPHAVFIDDVHPLAVNMVALAEKAYGESSFVDTAYFEPFYLKEFQATIAKNKVINEALRKNTER